VTLGRAATADVLVDDPAASRIHCEVVVDRGMPRIRDLGSRNGTIVDGMLVLDAYLRDGALIEIGQRKLRFEVGSGQTELPLHPGECFGKLVGRSRGMRRIFAQLEQAARTDATILLIGETGVGKEVVAESIVDGSSRARGPFVVVDCGAISRNLIESELFGHERGAFTSAAQARTGAFEAAHGGTLFLDEIGELPLDLQPKLLRALSKREVKRIGQTDFRSVDVRVIAATNRDLREEVDRKTFRSDLFYRLAVIEVRIPPLRDRLDDLDLLVRAILDGLRGDPAIKAELVARDTIARLQRHRWPGNVRELQNYLERSLVSGSRSELEDSNAVAASAASPVSASVDLAQPWRVAREQCIDTFDRAYLKGLLAAHGGNLQAVAKTAGMDRTTLARMLGKYRLRPP
jgi:transcriptional regulator with PAS, ATPase and Fis domain